MLFQLLHGEMFIDFVVGIRRCGRREQQQKHLFFEDFEYRECGKEEVDQNPKHDEGMERKKNRHGGGSASSFLLSRLGKAVKGVADMTRLVLRSDTSCNGTGCCVNAQW